MASVEVKGLVCYRRLIIQVERLLFNCWWGWRRVNCVVNSTTPCASSSPTPSTRTGSSPTLSAALQRGDTKSFPSSCLFCIFDWFLFFPIQLTFHCNRSLPPTSTSDITTHLFGSHLTASSSVVGSVVLDDFSLTQTYTLRREKKNHNACWYKAVSLLIGFLFSLDFHRHHRHSSRCCHGNVVVVL